MVTIVEEQIQFLAFPNALCMNPRRTPPREASMTALNSSHATLSAVKRAVS